MLNVRIYSFQICNRTFYRSAQIVILSQVFTDGRYDRFENLPKKMAL